MARGANCPLLFGAVATATITVASAFAVPITFGVWVFDGLAVTSA